MSEFQIIRRASHPAAAKVEQDFAELIIGSDITGDEREIITTVMGNPDANIDVAIPENISTEDLCRYIEACAKAHRRVGSAHRKLNPILGRLFILVQYRKDVLERFGCRTFTQFMNEFVPRRLQVNKNDAHSCMRIAREFPTITPNVFDGVSIAKLKAIARAIPYNNGAITERQVQTREKLIEDAKSKTFEELIYHMHDMGLVDKNEAMPAKILIRTNDEVRASWEKMIKDPKIHSYVGSENEGAILMAMIGECYVTWLAIQQANE